MGQLREGKSKVHHCQTCSSVHGLGGHEVTDSLKLGECFEKDYGKFSLSILPSGICYQPLMELGCGATQLVTFVCSLRYCKEMVVSEVELLKARQLIVVSRCSFLCGLWRVAGTLR